MLLGCCFVCGVCLVRLVVGWCGVSGSCCFRFVFGSLVSLVCYIVLVVALFYFNSVVCILIISFCAGLFSCLAFIEFCLWVCLIVCLLIVYLLLVRFCY